ncbi:MAG TPA: rod shape-determining protein MreD [Solirubrobacteraceae bacterium]|nr:rod shape-determining protein MreD [Solirubrobacteraceae bacterium]
MSTDRAQLAIRLGLLAIVAVLVQIAALSQVTLFGATPDLAPLIVVSAGLLAGPIAGALTGFSVGLFVDVALLQTLGVSSLVLVIIGHFAGRLRETVRDPEATLLPLVAGAAGTAVALTVFSLMQFLLGVESPVSVELLRQILATTLINTLLALPLHALARRVLGPALPETHRRRRRRRPSPLSPLIQP